MVRERLSQALDEAQRGEPVLIERAGVTYRLSVEGAAPRSRRRAPLIDVLDADVSGGSWTWDWDAGGMQFRGRARRRT